MLSQESNPLNLTDNPTVREYAGGLDPDVVMASLEEHVLDAWFPRIIDREYGGFLSDFDCRWLPSEPHNKMLESQARQARLAAYAALFDPSRSDLKQAAEHGFRFLKDVMWDSEYGGWYRMVDRQGQPLEAASKHGHGMTYAISACALHFKLTQDPDALRLAQEGFQWLERYAHDNQYGGYFIYFSQDGTLIGSPEQHPNCEPTDPMGNPLGLKDTNTNCDLLETLTDLYQVWPDPLVKQRISEQFTILRDRISVPSGALHFAFYPDWTPTPHLAIYGNALQIACQVLKAAQEIGVEEEARNLARRLVDHALQVAWDPVNGGFYYAGSATGRIFLDGQIIFADEKSWWVQAEGLRALLVMALLEPSSSHDTYGERFQEQWAYIQKHILDPIAGGWRRFGTDYKPDSQASKSCIWKDSSHEGRALINVIQMLRTGRPVCD